MEEEAEAEAVEAALKSTASTSLVEIVKLKRNVIMFYPNPDLSSIYFFLHT